MIRTNTPRSSKTSVSKTNFQTDTRTVRTQWIAHIWCVDPSPRAEMNKESKPKSHTRGPSIKFLLLLHSLQAPPRRILLLYDQQVMNDHTKRHIPSVTTKTHTQTYMSTHAHAHSRVCTPPDARTYPHTHTHIHTRARMQEQTFCIYSLPTTYAQTHKSQVNFKRFSISPTDTNCQHRYTIIISYHRC